MKIATKAVLAALALSGSAMAVSAPANAQVSAYVGVGDPDYGGYYGPDPYADPYYSDPYYADPYDNAYADPYADPYACDYYDPPWGYPPGYCAYQIWQEPIYVGGLWYSGPIYYRGFGANRLFWLNGGWHRDEWRGARPGRIDWGRNMRWSGPIHHRGDFAGRSNGYRGGNFAGRNWNGGNNFAGRSWNGGNNFAGRNWNNGGNFNRGGDRGRDFGGHNFVAPQNGGQRQAFQGGNFRGRFGAGNVAPAAGGQAFAQRGNAPNTPSLRGRFGGQSFQAGGPGGGARFGGQGGPRGGGGGGFQRGSGGGQGHRGH